MRKIKIRYEKNAHQEEFHQDVTTKYLHLNGGFSSGKTFALCMKMLQLSGLNKGLPGGLVCPSLQDYKKDVRPALSEILDANNVRYREHQSNHWFQFPWTAGRLYVVSAEKKIRGQNWAYAGLNEVTLISHERYKETIGRVRLKNATHPQIASSGTPEGTDHWLYEVFVEKPMENSRIIYGDTRNNAKNFAADYIKSLENSYDAIMLDAYLRGMFVNMKGNRFYYAYDPSVNDDKSIERIDGEIVRVTLDYNVSPMVATLWHFIQVRTEEGIPRIDAYGNPVRMAVAFDQIVIEDGADTHRMAQAFYEHGLDPATTIIYPDPAGASRSTKGPPDNEILKQNGFTNIKVRNVAPRFRQRQLAVCNMLSKHLIKLNPNKCTYLKKDLEAVSQDKGTLEKLKSNPKLTHASDGMDYMVDIEFPLSGNHNQSRSTRYR